MGFIPNDAINITGTPFNLLIMFNASRVHLKCHIIIFVCIAQLPCVDCCFLLSGVVCSPVDHEFGVEHHHSDEQFDSSAQQGKRNPPSEHILSYVSVNIFSTIILHSVLNVFCLD